MLTNFEVLLYASSLIVVLPIAIYSLLSGSKAPEGSGLRIIMRPRNSWSDRQRFPARDLRQWIVKLGMHFGFIDPALVDSLDLLVGIPFMALLVLYLGLWVRAFLRFAGMRMGRRVRNEASRRRRNLLFISLSGRTRLRCRVLVIEIETDGIDGIAFPALRRAVIEY